MAICGGGVDKGVKRGEIRDFFKNENLQLGREGFKSLNHRSVAVLGEIFQHTVMVVDYAVR